MKRVVLTVMLGSGVLLALPPKVWADGEHPVEKTGLTGGTYALLAFMLLLIVSAVVYALQKKRLDEAAAVKRPGAEAIAHRQRLDSRVRILRWIRMAALAGLILTGLTNVWQSRPSDDSVTMDHIHGLGYSPDGQKLMFAAHDGIKLLSAGHWSAGTGEKHDYMGFSVMDRGFYSSGHPAPGSKLDNPFGIIRSLDEGKSVEPLAFYGEIDFHVMTAGYRSHSLYVFNPQPHSQLKEQGIYVSLDEGKTWTRSKASGLSGEVTGIAAHPDQASTVAVGTRNGAYLSKDAGATFEPLFTGKQITGLSYDLEGNLLAGTYASKKAGLVRIVPDTQAVKEVPIPAFTDDAVAFIAPHPVNKQEISFVTYNRQAYTSTDGGSKWKPVVKDGKSLKDD